jgi:hypothetical protein
VHFFGAGVADHLDDLAARGAAHDRVVDHDNALAFEEALDRV